MHKKLAAELVSLAHSILQMKNKDDVNALHKKTHEIYEKLSVLKFVDEYINTTPNSLESKEEIVDKIEHAFVNEKKEEYANNVEPIEEIEKPEIISEAQVEEIFDIEDAIVKDDQTEIPSLQDYSLEDELKDAISADVATQLFEKATKENPVIEEITAR